MTQEPDHTGIPTRAIHEAYLDMQRALRQYRAARDNGDKPGIDSAHGDLQEAVLTLYELLRPHLKNNDGVADYWDGEPPRYPGNGGPPDPEDGKGVLQVQNRTDQFSVEDFDPEELDSLEDWHEELGLNGTVRLTSIVGTGDGALVRYQSYQLGLRHLDDWETKYQPKEERVGGFMGGKTKTTQRRARIDVQRLKRAARELSDVAERLGALSEFDASSTTTEITEEDMEKVEAWRQKTLNE